MKRKEFDQLHLDYMGATLKKLPRVHRGAPDLTFKVVGVNKHNGRVTIDVGYGFDSFHYSKLQRV